MRVTVSKKGQITVPKRLRERLDIRAGDDLEISEEGGRLVLSKARTTDPVDNVYGVLGPQPGTDETIKALRSTPDAV